MNDIERLKMLASAADREGPPGVDVAAAVGRRLSICRPPAVDRIMLIFTAISSVAAAVAVVMAVDAWRDWQDPLVALLDSINVVMQ